MLLHNLPIEYDCLLKLFPCNIVFSSLFYNCLASHVSTIPIIKIAYLTSRFELIIGSGYIWRSKSGQSWEGHLTFFVLKCWPLVRLKGWMILMDTFEYKLISATEFWPYEVGGRCSGWLFKWGTNVLLYFHTCNVHLFYLISCPTPHIHPFMINTIRCV